MGVWYEKGLRFKCTECGQCCHGSPGHVWVSEEEMSRIADHLKLPLVEFQKTYTRYVNGRYSLLDLPKEDYACVFLRGKRCSIYPVRPNQCQTFPWWPGHLESKEAWAEAALACEGINDDAPLIQLGEIQSKMGAYLPT